MKIKIFLHFFLGFMNKIFFVDGYVSVTLGMSSGSGSGDSESSGSHISNITQIADNRNSSTIFTPVYTKENVEILNATMTSFEPVTTAVEGSCTTLPCGDGQMCKETSNGYSCVSLCFQPDYCLNNGKCFEDSHRMPSCWCPSSSQWWYRGERCETQESILKLSLIAGGCGVSVIVFIGFLLLCMARMAVRNRPLSRHRSFQESIRRLRIPHSTASVLRNERALEISCGILSPVPPTFDATDDEIRENQPMTSTMVKYEKLGEITKGGESRTKFTSGGFTDVDSIDETMMSTGYSRSILPNNDRNLHGEMSSCSSSSNQCQTSGNWRLNRSPIYDVRS